MAVNHGTIAFLALREDIPNAQYRLEQVFKDCTDVLAHGDGHSSSGENAGIPSPLTEARTLSVCTEMRLYA